MPASSHPTEDASAVALAPEIEERLPVWRQRLDRIRQADHLTDEEANELRRENGREMAQAIAGRPAGQGITAMMRDLARLVGVQRQEIYDFMGVAQAFPGELPQQNWTVLTRLARMDEATREQWLARLKPWARVSDLPKATRDRKLTPQAEAALEERKVSQRLVDEIRERFAQLREEHRPYLLVELLGKTSLHTLPDYHREDVLSRIERAVAALHNPAPGPAADGATLDGPNDSPA